MIVLWLFDRRRSAQGCKVHYDVCTSSASPPSPSFLLKLCKPQLVYICPPSPTPLSNAHLRINNNASLRCYCRWCNHNKKKKQMKNETNSPKKKSSNKCVYVCFVCVHESHSAYVCVWQVGPPKRCCCCCCCCRSCCCRCCISGNSNKCLRPNR